LAKGISDLLEYLLIDKKDIPRKEIFFHILNQSESCTNISLKATRDV